MWFNILYYISIAICFTTCGVVLFGWVNYLIEQKKEKISDTVVDDIVE